MRKQWYQCSKCGREHHTTIWPSCCFFAARKMSVEETKEKVDA